MAFAVPILSGGFGLTILKNLMLLDKGFGPIIEDYVDVRNWDLDVILRNVCELNKLVSGIFSCRVTGFSPDTKIKVI